LAQVVAEQTHTDVTIKPNPKLSEMLYIAKNESEEIEPTDLAKVRASANLSRSTDIDDYDDEMDDDMDDDNGNSSGNGPGSSGSRTRKKTTHLEIDVDAKSGTGSGSNSGTPSSGPNLSTIYMTTHKDAVTCCAFSKDGRYAASGSADTSLKILDVNKMKMMNEDVHPVIRTLYDHTTPVTDVDFHPNGLVLAASSDTVVKLYDLSKPSVKRSFRYLQDSHPIQSVSFHPSGDFLLVGSESETVRIFDVKTLQCFTPRAFSSNDHSQQDSDQTQSGPHRGGINHIEYAPTGSVFITASQDGSIKVWDAVSGKVVRTISNAHSGKGVTSATISKNGKYILSGGWDSQSKLWDLGSGKLIHGFQGAVQKSEKQSTVFSYNEEFVFSTDESNNTIVCWDSRTATLVKRYSGHNSTIRALAASPTENGLVSGSNDHRVRYWSQPSPGQHHGQH
ncbi:cleavage stimulation factor, 3' pre-RNA, subunit 1, partial [Lunasporangiospora selenospora]